MKYIDLNCLPGKGDLVCDFLLEPAPGVALEKAAEEIAAESSVGTWTEVHTQKPYMAKLAAKVFSIKGNRIRIAYPQALFEPGNIPQILSSVAGNVFGMKDARNLRLEDIDFPRDIVKSFKGPDLGMAEIRKLVKVRDRPLVGTIIKPKIGLHPVDHAKVAYEAWAGGMDLVKCDENLTDQGFNRFEENLRESYRMLEKAEKYTGEKKIYAPNVTAETMEMVKRARMVKDMGGDCVMVDIVTAGWAGLQTLRNADLGLIIHAHRAGHGMFTRGSHGMSMLVVAKIARLIGVSQIHTGTANVGKMESGEGETVAINRFLRSEWHGLRYVFPIASGGLHPGCVPKLVKVLGKDIIIQAGGGVHGLGTRIGAASMRQAVEAAVNGYALEDYARKHKELRMAIEKWGVVK